MTRDDEEARDLLDAALRDEIELVSDLVVAASASERHFTPDEVDALLGLSRHDRPASAGGVHPAGPAPRGDEPPDDEAGGTGT